MLTDGARRGEKGATTMSKSKRVATRFVVSYPLL